MSTKSIIAVQPGTKHSANADVAATYNEFKEFEGRRYTGMKIGRSHKWYYDRGEWKEKKITPDQWEINYAVTKRQAVEAATKPAEPKSGTKTVEPASKKSLKPRAKKAPLKHQRAA